MVIPGIDLHLLADVGDHIGVATGWQLRGGTGARSAHPGGSGQTDDSGGQALNPERGTEGRGDAGDNAAAGDDKQVEGPRNQFEDEQVNRQVMTASGAWCREQAITTQIGLAIWEPLLVPFAPNRISVAAVLQSDAFDLSGPSLYRCHSWRFTQ